ncbi:MAG: hypothetical protein NTV80_21345, partial [Verrucomicrobia bacterium]|nr:hypothetical protein [Verrucomicrobiota bacterium]
RVNLVFDSAEMSLRQLWRGEFANLDFGTFHPRSREGINFPPGIPFHRLKSLDESWPYKGKTNHSFPQDHGYEWRGYTLDSKRRPTFRYTYGEIAVEEFFEDLRGENGQGYFKRTIHLDSPAFAQPFYFRAACGDKINTTSDTSFKIDSLHLHIISQHQGITREGEVLIPLTLPKGRSTLTLEYQW